MFQTLPDLIESLRDAPEGHGVAFGNGPLISWRTLWERVHARARALDAQPGDRVPVTLGNDAASLVTFLALLHRRTVPLSLPTTPFGQSPEARAAFVASVERAAERPVQEGVALVQFSSGSTTRPKGICLTHANLAANVQLVVEAGARRADEALVTWVPMSHDMGLVGTWLSSLAVRPRLMRVLQPMRFLMRPLTWLETMSRERSRVSTCPSFALDRCVERYEEQFLNDHAVDLSCVERLLVGAETVRPQTLARFTQAFEPWGLDPRALIPVYGLAEASLIVTAHTHGEAVATRRVDGTEVVSVGRPLGDFALRIAGDGDVGEIQLRGSSVTPGLLDADRTGSLLEDGWLRTGDLGCVDEAGRLYVTGRSKDLLIVDGRNYYAHDIGAALEDVKSIRPGRTHAFTAHVGDRKRVVVLAVRRGNVGSDEHAQSAIKRWVLARCGVAVDDVVFVRRIPRTSSGKVERHSCEALYRERALA